MRNLLLLGTLLLVPPTHAYQYWNDIRHSALLPDSSVTVRIENPSGAGIENYILYEGAVVEQAEMTPIIDGPATLSAVVPGPVEEARSYGFRLLVGDELDLMPVRIGAGVQPAPENLTQLAPDPAGDELFGYEHLDLVDCHVSFSGSAFYAALQNVGGGFPVSEGLTFFGYLLGIADPGQADPDTVFALMYTFEQVGIIGPGLYKITGTGLNDLERLGEIEIQTYPATNTLMLSCQLSDLYSDPDFMSWYDPSDPTLGVAGFTQRIQLIGGAREADRTPGGRCYLREFSIAPGTNQVPEIANVVFQGQGSQATAQIDYFDPDGHCPVLSEIVFDNSDTFPLYPQSLDYGAAVAYRTNEGIDPLAYGTWQSAVFRFSDNLSDVVEFLVLGAAINEEERPWETPALIMGVSPNPFVPRTGIELRMPLAGMTSVAIHDARGALVRTLLNEAVEAGRLRLAWDGQNDSGHDVNAGIFFLKVAAQGRCESRKIIRLR